jgi:hypothetical protein
MNMLAVRVAFRKGRGDIYPLNIRAELGYRIVVPGQRSIREYCLAFVAQWFTAMSGGLSVPLSVLAIFVENPIAKVGLAATAIACFVAASYLIWSGERTKVNELTSNLEARDAIYPKLELLFDENDPQFVQTEYYWYERKPPKSRRWYIAVHNASETKNADNVTVRAKASWFVSCTIAQAHKRLDRLPEENPAFYR